MRYKGRERIIGNLRFGSRNNRQERRFAGIGETYQSHVRQHFELQDDIPLLTRFTGLGITRSLVGGSTEMPVAESSLAAFEQDNPLAVFLHFRDILAGVAVIYDRSAWHFDNLILSVLAEAAALAAATAVGSHDVALVLEVQQRPEVAVALQDNMPAASAVAAVRTAFRHILGAMKVHATGTALSRAAVYLNVVYEVSGWHYF